MLEAGWLIHVSEWYPDTSQGRQLSNNAAVVVCVCAFGSKNKKLSGRPQLACHFHAAGWLLPWL